MKSKKVTSLLKVCRGKSPLLIMPHNHPDPDSLAGSWALQYLLEQAEGIASTIAYGGVLGREENRTFKKVLNIKAVRLSSAHINKFSSIALIDCQPAAGMSRFPLPENPSS